MKKLSRKVMAMTVVFGLCSGVAVLQKEKQVNDAKAVAALLAYEPSLAVSNPTPAQTMAGSVVSTYVGTCVSIGVNFIWGGPAGIAAGVVAGL